MLGHNHCHRVVDQKITCQQVENTWDLKFYRLQSNKVLPINGLYQKTLSSIKASEAFLAQEK